MAQFEINPLEMEPWFRAFDGSKTPQGFVEFAQYFVNTKKVPWVEASYYFSEYIPFKDISPESYPALRGISLSLIHGVYEQLAREGYEIEINPAWDPAETIDRDTDPILCQVAVKYSLAIYNALTEGFPHGIASLMHGKSLIDESQSPFLNKIKSQLYASSIQQFLHTLPPPGNRGK